jgi:hypothetical protein
MLVMLLDFLPYFFSSYVWCRIRLGFTDIGTSDIVLEANVVDKGEINYPSSDEEASDSEDDEDVAEDVVAVCDKNGGAKHNIDKSLIADDTRTSNMGEGNIRDNHHLVLKKAYTNMADYTQIQLLSSKDKITAFMKDIYQDKGGTGMRRNKMSIHSVTAAAAKKKQNREHKKLLVLEMNEAAAFFNRGPGHVPTTTVRQLNPAITDRYTICDTHNKTPLNPSNAVTFPFVAKCIQSLIPSQYANMTALCKDLIECTGFEWFKDAHRMNMIIEEKKNVIVPDDVKAALLKFLSTKVPEVASMETSRSAAICGDPHSLVIEPTDPSPSWWIPFCEAVQLWTNHDCDDDSDECIGRFMKSLQEKSRGMEWFTVNNWRKLLCKVEKAEADVPEDAAHFILEEMQAGGYLLNEDDHVLCAQFIKFVDRCLEKGWDTNTVYGKLRLVSESSSLTKELFHNLLNCSLQKSLPETVKLWLRVAMMNISGDSTDLMSSPLRPLKTTRVTFPWMTPTISKGHAQSQVTTKKRVRSVMSPSTGTADESSKKRKRSKANSAPPATSERVSLVTKSGRTASKFM